MLNPFSIRQLMRCSICITALAIALGALPSVSEAREALVITSETLMADKDNGVAVFTGGVEAKSEGMVMSALKMTAYYGEEGEVVSIVAEGEVRFVKALQVLTSDKAVYDMKERTVTFTGKPRAVDKGKVLLGQSMQYMMDTGVINVARSTVILNNSTNNAETGGASE